MATTIPTLPVFTGKTPVIGQTQPEFNQNRADKLAYDAQLFGEEGVEGALNTTIEAINTASAEIEVNAASAEASATSAESSANAAEAAASSAGYKGLWPDTGGSAENGETWQTQVGGVPTGEYYTALQNTTVDPVGDNVNWRAVVSFSSINGENLIANASFEVAGSVTNPPDATPRDYSAGDELFQGMFAVSALTGVTYVNGEINGTGQLYVDIPKTQKQQDSTSPVTPSIAGSDGLPKSGAAVVDNGTSWRVTYDMNDTFSVKLEQGSVATRHDVGVNNLFYLKNEIRGVLNVTSNLTLSGTVTVIDGVVRPASGVVVTIASNCKVISNCDWQDTSLGGTFNFQSGSFEKRMPDKVSSPTGGYIVNWGYPGNSIDESSGTSFVFGGTQSLPHTLGPQSQLSGILNGYDNHIVANAISSLICGGAHNYIKDGGNHGTVVGGAFNDVFAPFSFIGGGELNKNRATWSVIVGGQRNETGEDGTTPIDVRSSFVGGGESNKAKSLLSTVVCGERNETSGDWAAVLGGRNTDASGETSTAGGNNNTASGDSSTAFGTSNEASGFASTTMGSSNKATANYSSAFGFFSEANGSGSTVTGQYAKAELKSQRSHGSPAFAEKGSAQISDLVAAALTVGSQSKTLHLGIGGVDLISIPNNTTWFFSINLIARNIDTNGESGAWIINGAIKKDSTSSSTALVGTPVVTVINSPAGWDNGSTPSVTPDTTNGAMNINVSTAPSVSDSIRWVARVNLTEVSG